MCVAFNIFLLILEHLILSILCNENQREKKSVNMEIAVLLHVEL